MWSSVQSAAAAVVLICRLAGERRQLCLCWTRWMLLMIDLKDLSVEQLARHLSSWTQVSVQSRPLHLVLQQQLAAVTASQFYTQYITWITFYICTRIPYSDYTGVS